MQPDFHRKQNIIIVVTASPYFPAPNRATPTRCWLAATATSDSRQDNVTTFTDHERPDRPRHGSRTRRAGPVSAHPARPEFGGAARSAHSSRTQGMVHQVSADSPGSTWLLLT